MKRFLSLLLAAIMVMALIPAASAESVEDALAAAAEKVKSFVCVELNMGQMIEDVRLYTHSKRPVTLCNRCGGMIPSPEQVLESIRKAQKGE